MATTTNITIPLIRIRINGNFSHIDVLNRVSDNHDILYKWFKNVSAELSKLISKINLLHFSKRTTLVPLHSKNTKIFLEKLENYKRRFLLSLNNLAPYEKGAPKFSEPIKTPETIESILKYAAPYRFLFYGTGTLYKHLTNMKKKLLKKNKPTQLQETIDAIQNFINYISPFVTTNNFSDLYVFFFKLQMQISLGSI